LLLPKPITWQQALVFRPLEWPWHPLAQAQLAQAQLAHLRLAQPPLQQVQ
jgi:hypothetical protein